MRQMPYVGKWVTLDPSPALLSPGKLQNTPLTTASKYNQVGTRVGVYMCHYPACMRKG